MPNDQPPPSVLDSIDEGCQVIGPDWTYLYLNAAAARQGKRPRDELIGRSMIAEYPGIDRTPMWPLLTKCMEERKPQRFENEFTFPDGSLGWFDLRFEPVPEGVFILSVDITPRKHAELQQRRLAAAIDQSSESVIMTSADGTIYYVNPSFEAVSGYSRDEVLGQKPSILKSNRHDDAFFSDLWRTISSGKPWRGRMVNRRKDGSLITEDVAISPIFDASAQVSGHVCVKHDVTRELNLEEQFRQAQKMEAIGQLAGGVAHDFNNILSLIIGYCDVMLQTLGSDHPLRSDIGEIRVAGERATALTRQLLAFSRKQVMRFEHLELNAVITEMVGMLKRSIPENIELQLRTAAIPLFVRADATQLEQVVLNLVINARDAMQTAGSSGTIAIDTALVELDDNYTATHFAVDPGKYAMLAVSDTGPGMDDKTRARIFEPFFTTKGAHRGTGLGLSTVYGIIKQAGGSIWVYSELGVGTTFKFYLPEVPGVVQPAAAPKKEAVAATATGETILLVEDEDSVRNLTKRMLTKSGYSVLTASNAIEALGICEKHDARVDLVLTDVVMPKMGGVELAKRLAELYPGIRVVFMSGYLEDSVSHFDELGASARFIGKPFSATDLSRKVREVLDEGR